MTKSHASSAWDGSAWREHPPVSRNTKSSPASRVAAFASARRHEENAPRHQGRVSPSRPSAAWLSLRPGKVQDQATLASGSSQAGASLLSAAGRMATSYRRRHSAETLRKNARGQRTDCRSSGTRVFARAVKTITDRRDSLARGERGDRPPENGCPRENLSAELRSGYEPGHRQCERRRSNISLATSD